MSFVMAREFLIRAFLPEETIAVLLRREEPAKVAQRIVTLETVLSYRYLAWLAHENAAGMNVYVAANPLLSGSRKRTKASMESVRHLYLDIDDDSEARIEALLRSGLVPSPSAVVKTSPSKYQVLWKVDEFSFEEQEKALNQLANTFGGDRACTDCNRVLRLPGFLNRKYAQPHVVTAEYRNASVFTPEDFRLPEIESVSTHSDSWSSVSTMGKGSASEMDWAWVCDELKKGANAAKLSLELASHRSDKANPKYYAQRTVDIASARMWLLEGIPYDDIITMLKFRREQDYAPATCSARAREIVDTAMRLLRRKKIA